MATGRTRGGRAVACRACSERDFAAANLAAVHVRQGRAREGIDLLERRRQQAMVDEPGASLATLDVSLAKARLATGELAEAQASLTTFVSSGRSGGILLATAHGHPAEIALVQNDALRAGLHAGKLTTISRRVGNSNFRACAAYIEGRAAAAAGRRDDAKTLLRSAITLQTECGSQLLLPDALEALAEAAGLDDPAEATRLLAAAERARDRLGISRPRRSRALVIARPAARPGAWRRAARCDDRGGPSRRAR